MRRLLITALVALAFIMAAMVPTMAWADNSYNHNYRNSYGARNGSGPKKWHKKHHRHHKMKHHSVYQH